MARKMVGKRPGLMIAIGVKSAKPMGHAEPESDAEEAAESPAEEQREEETGEEKLPPHEVLCKVCNTVIDTETGEPVEDAKNKQDAEDGKDIGAPIDNGESSYPTPGKLGAAADAARGEIAISRALSMLGGKR